MKAEVQKVKDKAQHIVDAISVWIDLTLSVTSILMTYFLIAKPAERLNLFHLHQDLLRVIIW